MTTTIENSYHNKRKFLSDDEVQSPSTSNLSANNQIDTNSHTKKVKSIEIEQSSSSLSEIDDMMICEDSTSKENSTTNKSQPVLIPKYCNALCNADASPTTFKIRCYCHPYKLNALMPYDTDIY